MFDIDGELKKIQVKATTSVAKSGSYAVDLRDTGGYHRHLTVKPFAPDGSDFLFIYCADESQYFIPTNVINTNNITVGNKYTEYQI